MNCSSCSRTTLGLLIRSFTNTDLLLSSPNVASRSSQPSRFFSLAGRLRNTERASSNTSHSPNVTVAYKRSRRSKEAEAVVESSSQEAKPTKEKGNARESWQVQKAALKEKLSGAAWNPRKKLSPDTMEGIRHLHQTHPEKFTTPVLAEHFQVSPEAIRRILKSKWRPSDEEAEERLKRWDKRGERIWSNLVELGVKPPKRWREMGVGKARPGQLPMWKSKSRNTVVVNDSSGEELIPIVDGTSKSKRPSPQQEMPFVSRLM